MSKVKGVYGDDRSGGVSVKRERKAHGVEGGSIYGLIDLVRASDSVGCQKGNDFEGSETSGILETLENFGHIVLRLRNQAVDGGDGVVGAAGKELQAGCTL